MVTDQQGLTQLYFLNQDFFSEIHTYVCKKIRCSFNSGTHIEAKRMHFQFCPVTDRQTDCYNPPPTLGLIILYSTAAAALYSSTLMITSYLNYQISFHIKRYWIQYSLWLSWREFNFGKIKIQVRSFMIFYDPRMGWRILLVGIPQCT